MQLTTLRCDEREPVLAERVVVPPLVRDIERHTARQVRANAGTCSMAVLDGWTANGRVADKGIREWNEARVDWKVRAPEQLELMLLRPVVEEPPVGASLEYVFTASPQLAVALGSASRRCFGLARRTEIPSRLLRRGVAGRSTGIGRCGKEHGPRGR